MEGLLDRHSRRGAEGGAGGPVQCSGLLGAVAAPGTHPATSSSILGEKKNTREDDMWDTHVILCYDEFGLPILGSIARVGSKIWVV